MSAPSPAARAGGPVAPPSLAGLRVRAWPALAVASAGSAVLLLYLTRHFDFFYDEWTWLLAERQGWAISDYFQPHNEHWVTLPMLAYRTLLAVFATHSYVPYMALLAGLHVLAAWMLFLLLRRECGDLVGLAAAALMLFLGAGWEDLLWAFQIEFVGAVALGLAAMVLVGERDPGPRRLAAAAAALVAALMCSGEALFFAAALAVGLAARGRWRHLLVVAGPGAVAYLAWFAAFGRSGMAGHHSLLSLSTLRQEVQYVPVGIGFAAGSVLGVPWHTARAGLLLLVAILGAGWWYRRPSAWSLGAAAGILVMYGATGLVRGQYGPNEAEASRYVYVGGYFVLMLVAPVVGRLPARPTVAALAAAVAAWGVLFNVLAMFDGATYRLSILQMAQASQETVWAVRSCPGLRLSAAVDPMWMPGVSVAGYLDVRSSEGYPLPDTHPADLAGYPAPLVDAALQRVLGIGTPASLPAGCAGSVPG